MKIQGPEAHKSPAGIAVGISPRQLLRILQRRWLVVALISLPMAMAAAAATWYLLPAQYTAYALVRIAAIEPRLVFNTAEQGTDFRTYRQTQVALLRSRFVLNAALRDPSVSSLATIREEELPIEWLQANLQVTSEGTPEILRIELTGDRPQELAQIVNAVKDAYLEEVVNAERRQRVERLKNLERIFQETEKEVRSKESRIENLARQLGTGDTQALSVKQQMAVEYFGQIRQEHSRVRFELMREQVNRAALDNARGILSPEPAATAVAPTQSLPADSVSAEAEPYVRVLLIRIQQIEALIARYEKHVVRKDEQVLADYRAELSRLRQELEVLSSGRAAISGAPSTPADRLEVLTQQEALLREEVEKYSNSIQDLGTSSYELEAMQAELGQVTQISDRIGSEIEALRVELQSPSRITPLQQAETPRQPDIGKRVKMTGMTAFACIGLIAFLFVLSDFVRGRVSAPEELEEHLGIRVLSSIPALIKGSTRAGSPADNLWRRAVVESIDTLRAVLHEQLRDVKRPVILVGSAEKGEGKSTLSLELAQRMAHAGQRTALVDLDLRCPAIHERIGVDLDPGLADYLRGELSLDSVVRPSNQLGLWVISAGEGDSDAIAKLSRPGQVQEMLNALRNEFDVVIIDTPPLMLTADAMTVGRYADAVLLCACCMKSRLRSLGSVLDRIIKLNLPLLGAVVLGAKVDLKSYSYGRDYLEPQKSRGRREKNSKVVPDHVH